MSFDENISISDDEEYGVISVNPEIFSLEVIYPAAYTFLDRAYFVFEGDPDEEIRLKVKPKSDDEDIEELVYEIQNEFVNYAVYIIQSSRNQEIRNAIIQRALGTKGTEDSNDNSEHQEEEDMIGPDEDFEDSKGIAEPWTPDQAEGISDESENEGCSDKGEVETEGKKAVIDDEKCIDCGVCVTTDPENFYTEDGKVKVVDEGQELTGKTVDAYKTCPMDAIEFVED